MTLPHLVLLPGLDGTGWNFEPLLSCLAEGESGQPMALPQDPRATLDSLREAIELPTDESHAPP